MLPRLFKLWRSTRRESKGCEVHEVSNAERIPITMVLRKHKASLVVFNTIKQLLMEYYTELRSKVQTEEGERCVNDDFEEFDSAYDLEASQQTDAE